MKLYTYPALFRTQKVLITAEYAGVKIEVDQNVTADKLKALSVHGKVPCLETKEGTISESNAITRYIARQGPSGLYGSTAFETAQIDSWVDFCSDELEIPATLWIAPILGWMENNEAVTTRAISDLKKGIQVLEGHMKTETYIVGKQITIADIAIATTLLLPMKLVLDEKARKGFPNVCRWFDLCVNQIAFLDIIGATTLCSVPLVASASSSAKPAEKKEEKKAPEGGAAGEKRKQEQAAVAPVAAPAAKPKKAEEEADMADEAAKEEKKKNPLDDLPKSKLVLDEWKRTYSNAPGGDCTKAMPWFFENYDNEGYSLWLQDYKYNEELKVTFMTSNLCGGFLQRSDEMRKYAFGVMQIVGTSSAQKITGAWLIRGQDIKPMLDANEDAESYTWTKMSKVLTDAEKARLTELWCAENEIEVGGVKEKILDCKVFK